MLTLAPQKTNGLGTKNVNAAGSGVISMLQGYFT
jgi:hypothetical protein